MLDQSKFREIEIETLKEKERRTLEIKTKMVTIQFYFQGLIVNMKKSAHTHTRACDHTHTYPLNSTMLISLSTSRTQKIRLLQS